MSLVLASVEKIGVLIQNRQWLVGLAALDWPVKKTFQTLSWLAAGEICEADFRILTPAFIEKLSLSYYQVKTAKKFFSEYNFDSFQVWLESQNIRVSTQLDSDYPALLKQLDLVPPVLWHRGLWPITAKLVAVVGTRRPSPQGMTMTEKVVTEIIELGFGVVSGFMYGADQIAQQQALKAGGQSVGVLGFGLSQMYPASFYTLAKKFLIEGGTLISPFAPWVLPQKWRFLDRNKVVAGLAQAVIVTEAMPRSGTHTTITAAADLGRLAGVLASPCQSQFNLGVKTLLDQGVTLIAKLDDFLAELQPKFHKEVCRWPEFQSTKLLDLANKIFLSLHVRPQSLTELAESLQLDLLEVTNRVITLELAGLVKREGTKFRLLPGSTGVIECSSVQRLLS